MGEKVRVGIVGLEFGAEFVPIYQRHPNAEVHAICRRNKERLDELGDQFGIERRYTSFEDMLAVDEIDAIHIVSPIADHAAMTIASLDAGKHTACTVPMATSVEDCLAIVEAKKRAQKAYMMMETAVYTREFLFVKELVETGKLGKIQFLRGAHQQNMGLPGWPEYWYGFPPMHYATHAVSPLLALAHATVDSVIAHGSGKIRDEYARRYNAPFAVETATLRLRDQTLVAEVTRSLFDTIRQYRESFDVYGDKLSVEWEQLQGEGLVVFSGYEDAERVQPPDYAHLLPEAIAPFTLGGVYGEGEHTSFIQGAGHGGSHPHMAHEFITSIAEGRDSAVDAAVAANWTMAGICAHESAMKNGLEIAVPQTA